MVKKKGETDFCDLQQSWLESVLFFLGKTSMKIINSFQLDFSKEKFQCFGWNSNTKIFQPKPKIFPLGNAAAWCLGIRNSKSYTLISLYAPWYSWFPLFQTRAAASSKLYFLIPDGGHTLDKWMGIWLCRTPTNHHTRRKHLDFKKQVTTKKVSLKSKHFFKVNLIENPWFLSTGSFKTAIFFQLLENILLLSIIPVFYEVWVQLDIVIRLPKHSRRCGFSISMSFERNIQVLKSALTISIYTYFCNCYYFLQALSATESESCQRKAIKFSLVIGISQGIKSNTSEY